MLGAHNTFEAPNRIRPTKLYGIRLQDGILSFRLPPASESMLELK